MSPERSGPRRRDLRAAAKGEPGGTGRRRSRLETRSTLEVLDDAEGLANVLRLVSDGRLDLRVVLTRSVGPPIPLSWEGARTEARRAGE